MTTLHVLEKWIMCLNRDLLAPGLFRSCLSEVTLTISSSLSRESCEKWQGGFWYRLVPSPSAVSCIFYSSRLGTVGGVICLLSLVVHTFITWRVYDAHCWWEVLCISTARDSVLDWLTSESFNTGIYSFPEKWMDMVCCGQSSLLSQFPIPSFPSFFVMLA